MINGNRILSIITARGGSKGIPHKNIIPILNKPLIGYTIEEAKKSIYIDTIIVSTDDPKIAEVTESYGVPVPFLRPVEIARDTSSSEDAVTHSIQWLKDNRNDIYQTFILLQPTSPLRRKEHIDEAIYKYTNTPEATSLISVTQVKQFPWWMKTITPDGFLQNFIGDQTRNTRRQDLPELFIPNGAIYISDVALFLTSGSFTAGNTLPFLMSEEDSTDIDDHFDIKLAELLLQERQNEN